MEVIDTLQSAGQITEEQAQAATEAYTAGTSPEKALLDAGVSADTVRTAMADYYNVEPYTPEEDIRIPDAVLELLPEESARHYQVIPLQIVDDILLVGVNRPDDVQIREVLNFVSARHHQPYKMVYLLPDDLDRILKAYASLSGEVGQALTSLETELDEEIAARQKENNNEPTEEHFEEDAPVTKIVATILRYAVDGGASDIHVEPFQGKVRVRFRIDGTLVTNLQLPQNVQSAVVARVKILSSMRLDERRKPQDGRFSATFDNRRIDFRVSVMPTNEGEKVVMRILDSSKGVHTLAETGISEYNLKLIERMTQEPYGIILISGPTGSGKSTTLYSMLAAVDRETKNVLSLEDPVEYNIAGVAQSQVRPEIGYTFAAGLRSVLRQDPDIILVGEIRDKETAQLAIQAALTGHLVFSTIHTNNAIGVVPRLIDMGVDPYLIAPTLKLAVAQRLARRICPDTGRALPVTGTVKDMVEETFSTLPAQYHNRIPERDHFLKLEPNDTCPSGTKGRIAITECLAVTDEIEDLILNNASEDDIYQAARKNGFVTMKEDAIIKALEHHIPFEEVGAFGTQVGETTSLTDSTEPFTAAAETAPSDTDVLNEQPPPPTATKEVLDVNANTDATPDVDNSSSEPPSNV